MLGREGPCSERARGQEAGRSLDGPYRVRGKPRLRSSRGSQEDPEKWGHVSCRRKEKGGTSGSRETEEGGISPLCRGRGRKKTPWKMIKMTEVEEAERGRCWKKYPGKGRREEGQEGRRNCWRKALGRRGGEQGRTAGVEAPRAPRRALSTSLSLSLPQCQCPASQACTPSYAPTGTGRHDGRPPANSGLRCSTHPGKPALLSPCQPATLSSGLSQGPSWVTQQHD